MRILVDRTRCTGQAMCESLAPDVFEVNDEGLLTLADENASEDRLADVEEAVACCPNSALRLVP